MATSTLYQFTPAANSNFSFMPTLDGSQYNVIVTWALFGRRWIVNIYDLSGALIVAKPLRGSPDNYDINLIEGYFTSTTLVYRTSQNNFIVTG